MVVRRITRSGRLCCHQPDRAVVSGNSGVQGAFWHRVCSGCGLPDSPSRDGLGRWWCQSCANLRSALEHLADDDAVVA